MQSISKLRRFGTLLLAGAVLALTATVVVQAEQTIAVPNEAIISYNLAAGANSTAFQPALSQPVFLMGTCNTLGYRGVGSVTLLHIQSSFLEWTGLESTTSSAITQGFSGSAGTHILYLDYSHQVDVQVAGTDTIYVHNAASATRNGYITLIW